jgi:hypothetical protein
MTTTQKDYLMIRARRWVYKKKAIDHEVDYDINHHFLGGNLTARIPTECQEFFRNNKQVICPDQRIRFMTLEAIRKEVVAGNADDWDVIDFDFDSDEATLVCVYCVTGIEHPDDGASSVEPTLH